MIGVIDIGGGTRGVYGAGVLDYCMDNDIHFDYCIGISAGSANLMSYICNQRGRNYTFYTEYFFRREYMSAANFFKTGSYISLDYIFSTLSKHDGENPLDYDTGLKSGKQYVVVAMNANTGKPCYFPLNEIERDDFWQLKASSNVPVADRAYMHDGVPYFDGGLVDPIPIDYAFAHGCDKVVAIVTRPKDYRRDSRKDEFLARFVKRRYPKAGMALANRANVYNRELERCIELEKEGKVLIVSPDSIGNMGTLTKDLDAINGLYNKGYHDAERIKEFISK